MNCLFCTLCSLFPINTKSMSFYREVLVSTPSLFLFYPPNLPPRQVVRRSLLFFFVSLRRVRKVFTVASVRTVLDVTNVVIPIEMTLTTFLERDITTKCPKLSAGSKARCFPARCYDVWQLFVVFLLWTGPRARILKLPMRWCKPDEGTHRFLWPMQDGPRGI